MSAYSMNTATKPSQFTAEKLRRLAEPEAEQAVLAAMILEREAFKTYMGELNDSLFIYEPHKVIFSVLQEIFLKNEPLDSLILYSNLKNKGLLSKIAPDDKAGILFLSNMIRVVNSATNIKAHIQIIKEVALKRQVITFADELMQKAHIGSISETLNEAQTKILGLDIDLNKNSIVSIGSGLIDFFEKEKDFETELQGLQTGYEYIDNRLGGFMKSDLIILAARPSMGKTAFALNLMKNISLVQKVPLGFFSIEMDLVKITKRLLSLVAQFDSNFFKKKLSEYSLDLLSDAAAELGAAPIFIDTTSAIDIDLLCQKARVMKREHNIAILFIDYLQQITVSSSKKRIQNREQEVAEVAKRLKSLAKELAIPIVALSQLSRLKAADNRPTLQDLRDSGQLEQEADVVMFMHRPEYYKEFFDAAGNSLIGKTEIIHAKVRDGNVGSDWLDFEGKYSRFLTSEYKGDE